MSNKTTEVGDVIGFGNMKYRFEILRIVARGYVVGLHLPGQAGHHGHQDLLEYERLKGWKNYTKDTNL